jgi:hypothetical protein
MEYSQYLKLYDLTRNLNPLRNYQLRTRHFLFFFHGSTVPRGPRSLLCRDLEITLRYTTVDRTPLHDWSDRRIDLYLTIQNTTDWHPWPRRDSKPQFHKREAAGPRLRPRGHWHQHKTHTGDAYINNLHNCTYVDPAFFVLPKLNKNTSPIRQQICISKQSLFTEAATCFGFLEKPSSN